MARLPQPDDLVRALARAGLTVAVAESLTGGALTARLVDVPGASAVVRGAVVAYATEIKAQVLGVDPALLAQQGPVHPDVARQMADGVRSRLGADVGVATTGVAGPSPQDGRAVGTMYVAVSGTGTDGQDVAAVRGYRLAGDRTSLRESAVGLALALVRGTVLG